MSEERKLGPNAKRLAIRKMSMDAIPPGGSVGDGINFLLDRKRLSDSARAAEEWTVAAIDAVRSGADPNPWREADDEAIAGEILSKVVALMKEPR